jgi:prolipoprotein diacylglyceryl transferase
MMLAAIPAPPTDAIEVGPLTIHFYGLAIAAGVLAAIYFLRRRYAALGGDPDLADRTALWAALFAVIGARIGHILPRLDRYIANPLDMIAIWRGGLTFFGALAGGLIAVLWHQRRNQAPLSTFLHAVAPAVPLAQAIGRWGNYFNQELYGRPTALPWALEVDPEHRMPGFRQFETFHPTFLYEMVWNLGLIGVLVWIDRRFTLRRGSLFFCYLIGYGVGRFWIELLRIDTDFRLLGLSRNNLNALLIVAIGAVGLVWWERRALVPTTAEPIEGRVPATDTAPGDPTEKVEDSADERSRP